MVRNDYVLEKIRPTLVSVFHVDPSDIKEGAVPSDIDGWDSLGHIKMFAALEGDLGIVCSMSEMIEVDSINSLLDLLSYKMK